MKNKKLLSLAIISTLIAGSAFNLAFATSQNQWPTLSSTAPLQVSADGTSDGQITPVLVKDANGDYVHYWVDFRNSLNGQIFGQKVDSDGNIVWATGDVMINSAPDGAGTISPAVADSLGNTLVAYSDYDGDVFVMQTSPSGIINWTTQVSDANTGYNPNLLVDSNDNVWINWYDDHTANTLEAVALLDTNGNTPASWNTTGSGTHRVLSLTTALLAAPAGSNLRSNMALSNNDSLLLSFENLNVGTTHVIKINSDGSFPWNFSPGNKKYLTVNESILDENFDISRTTAFTDHNNGIYVAYSNTDNTILKAIHVDQDGNFISGSATGGVELATADGFDYYINEIQITSDTDGNFFVAYNLVERQPDSFSYSVMVQKFDSNLTPQWNGGNFYETGKGFMDDPDLRYYNLLPDGAGGLIIGYYEDTGGGLGRLYADRILSFGSNDWLNFLPPFFFPVHLDLTNADVAGGSEVGIVSNGCNGAVFNWTNATYIYTQNVKSIGAVCSGATVPDAPTGLNGTPGDRQVVLNWTAPNNDGGSAITNYFVQYKLASSADWLTDSSGFGTSTTRTVRFLTNDLPYNFRVAAVNAVGTGSYTSSITATPTAGGGGGGGSGCTSGGNVVCGSQAIECPSLINSFGTGTDAPANFQIGDDGSRSISSSNDTSFVETANASYFDNDNDSNYNDTTDQLSINSNTPLTCANAGKFVQLTVSATPFLNGSSQELLSYGADNEAGSTSTAADYYAMLSIITNADTTCDTNCTLAEGSIESNNSTKHGEENFFASATLGNSSPAAGFDDTAVLIDNDGGLNTVTLYNSSLGFEGSLTIPGLRYNLALPANPAHSGSFSSTITYTLNS